jgi:hypothetical protein
MNSDQKLGFLRDEYLKLQDQYEDFDRRALTIKGWVGAGSAAAMAIGLDSNKSGGGAIWIITIVLSLCFWYLEARWKQFQFALQDRIRILEAHFRGDMDILVKDPAPFQIFDWWNRSYENDEPIYEIERERRGKPKTERLRRAAALYFVMMPYAAIIVLSLFGLLLEVIR